MMAWQFSGEGGVSSFRFSAIRCDPYVFVVIFFPNGSELAALRFACTVIARLAETPP
jgi:hypothetical protein